MHPGLGQRSLRVVSPSVLLIRGDQVHRFQKSATLLPFAGKFFLIRPTCFQSRSRKIVYGNRFSPGVATVICL
jgi:hypothetical protein